MTSALSGRCRLIIVSNDSLRKKEPRNQSKLSSAASMIHSSPVGIKVSFVADIVVVLAALPGHLG